MHLVRRAELTVDQRHLNHRYDTYMLRLLHLCLILLLLLAVNSI